MIEDDVKAKWIAALESGEYVQGAGHLRNASAHREDRWCCLGVLTDLAIKAGACPNLEWVNGDLQDTTRPGEIIDWGMPPDSVYDWAGLTEDEAMFLAYLNDNGTPFNVISSYIGRHL